MSIESLGPTAGNTANVAENLEEQKAGLDGTPAPEVPSTDPKDIIATVERDLAANPEALAELKEALPKIDEALDSPAVQEVMQEQGLQPNEELLASFRALVGGEDIKVFRSQVIRAFKHLGLDTRKFFGE